jgi:uroporphyrinogen III methyltransferase / synthase
MNEQFQKSGRVILIGAGPGDPDLITVKGLSLLNSCDVVVYDNLIPHELIVLLPSNVKRIYVGKISHAHTLPQEEINELLVDLAKDGKTVARLKGGDPFVFGRGGEEAEYLRDNNVEFEVVPGITSGLAGAATAGIPASHRDMSSSILLMTAHSSGDNDFVQEWKWASNINHGTIIGYMGVKQLPRVIDCLIKNGMSPDTEAALVERACFSTQRVVRAKLKDLPKRAEEEHVHPPAIFIIGEVASLSEKLAWYNRSILSGVRVMVARPADQSKWIYQILRGLGAEVLAYPTINTGFVADTDGWERFASVSGENNWLLFSSENSVRYFFGYLKSKQIDMRSVARFRIAATGSGTIRTLTTLGYFPDFAPDISGTMPFSNEMVDKLEVEGANIVRIKGHMINDPISTILSQAGANVLPLCVYKTKTAKWDEEVINRLFWYPPNLMMFTSARSVDGLVEIIGIEKTRQLASQARIATIGPMTTNEVHKYELNVEIEATRYSIPDLINQIAQYYQQIKK